MIKYEIVFDFCMNLLYNLIIDFIAKDKMRL